MVGHEQREAAPRRINRRMLMVRNWRPQSSSFRLDGRLPGSNPWTRFACHKVPTPDKSAYRTSDVLALHFTGKRVNQEVTRKNVATLFSCGRFNESDRLFSGIFMPGAGHRFYFVGKVPLPFSVLACLLFVNTFLMLFLPKATVGILRWYGDNSVAIQFVLLALLAAVMVISRKRVRWSGQK
jgi:hypothetical protein